MLYVEPVYASPGASDAASSYPRLIRVAMMYNDRVGYGPTVRDALTELFGPGADATATGPAPTAAAERATARRASHRPTASRPRRSRRRIGLARLPKCRWRFRRDPAAPCSCRRPKPQRLQEVNTALDGVRQAQQGGNFADYGEALQRLDDAIKEYQSAR